MTEETVRVGTCEQQGDRDSSREPAFKETEAREDSIQQFSGCSTLFFEIDVSLCLVSRSSLLLFGVFSCAGLLVRTSQGARLFLLDASGGCERETRNVDV